MNARPQLKAKAISTFLSKGRRPVQEDHLLVDREKGVFVVADGFGGPVCGVAAAKNACEAVRNFLFKEAGDLEATLPFVIKNYFSLAGNVLFNALIHANRKVTSMNKGKTVHEKGGASVLAGFIDGNLLSLANVGTCTAFLFRHDQVVELVVPRSFGRLVDPFAKRVHADYQYPLMALGMSEDLEPEIIEYRIQAGDWLLLGTDGFPKELVEEVILIKQKKFKFEESANHFTHFLNQWTFEDNAAISLVIL